MAEFHVYVGLGGDTDPGRFVFYENWTSPEHLDRHAASAHIQEFRTVTADLLAAPPRIETYWRIA